MHDLHSGVEKRALVRFVLGNVEKLIMDENGAGVLRKCLKDWVCDSEDCDILLDKILSQKNKLLLARIMQHEYAWLVINRLWQVLSATQAQRLLDEIEERTPSLHDTFYGRCSLNTIEDALKQFGLVYGAHVLAEIEKAQQIARDQGKESYHDLCGIEVEVGFSCADSD